MNKLPTLEELYEQEGITPRKATEPKTERLDHPGIYLIQALQLAGFTQEEVLRLSVIITEDKGFKEDLKKRVNGI